MLTNSTIFDSGLNTKNHKHASNAKRHGNRTKRHVHEQNPHRQKRVHLKMMNSVASGTHSDGFAYKCT